MQRIDLIWMETELTAEINQSPSHKLCKVAKFGVSPKVKWMFPDSDFKLI